LCNSNDWLHDNCLLTYWGEYYKDYFIYLELIAVDWPYIQDNDECTRQIFNYFFWIWEYRYDHDNPPDPEPDDLDDDADDSDEGGHHPKPRPHPDYDDDSDDGFAHDLLYATTTLLLLLLILS
jgi:hypothetical protein